MPKVSIDNLEIPYGVAYRSVRYPRLEFKTGNLLVIMPKGKKSAKAIVEKHKKWIAQKTSAISEALLRSRKKRLNLGGSKQHLKKLVLEFAGKFASKYDFHIKGFYFRAMNSKWASHSKNDNLTLNTALRYLPQRLIEYVVFHEMAHSVERRHNKRFWKTVELEFRNHKQMEDNLMAYWFIVHERAQTEGIH